MLDIVTFNSTDPHINLFQSLPKKIYKSPSKETFPSELSYFLAMNDKTPIARLSCTIKDNVANMPKPCGIIGHYETIDSTAGVLLLNKAKEYLANRHAKMILGPINNSTWERYRLVLPKTSEDPTFDPPVFLGEPQNPSDYPLHFINAGFTIIDNYESRIVHDLNQRQSKAQSLRSKMDRLKISVRPIDLENFDQQLHEIYLLSSQMFSVSPFYQPIDFKHFKMLYEDIIPILDPEFIILARNKNHQLIGFIFAYPDLYSMQEGLTGRLVFKTIAVSDNFRSSGLSLFLCDQLHLKAYEKGYASVIHALMHSDNNSLKLSIRGYTSDLFNRYALFGWVPE